MYVCMYVCIVYFVMYVYVCINIRICMYALYVRMYEKMLTNFTSHSLVHTKNVCMYVISGPSVAVVFTAKSRSGGVKNGFFGMQVLFTTPNTKGGRNGISRGSGSGSGSGSGKAVVVQHFTESMWGDVLEKMATKSNDVRVAKKRPSLSGTYIHFYIHIYLIMYSIHTYIYINRRS